MEDQRHGYWGTVRGAQKKQETRSVVAEQLDRVVDEHQNPAMNRKRYSVGSDKRTLDTRLIV